jgi:hypothetical protein
MLTSSDGITRKLMKQFEIEQARNGDIEYKELEPGSPGVQPICRRMGAAT